MTIATNTTENTNDTIAAVGELLHVDPRGLLIDRNIRDAQLDKEFVASIKAHGVLVAITAVTTAEGAMRVRYGHRRTLAAIEAERPTVPVWVVGAEDDDETARVLAQWAENEHRAGLSESERVGAVEQLTAFGLSAGQIARKLHTPRRTVDAAITAAGSEIARAAVARYDFLTIEQAATVAAFENDGDAVKALVTAAKLGPVEFSRAVHKARADADDRAARAAALDGIACPVIDRPGWMDTAKRIKDYVDAGGAALTPETHAQCPGSVAWLDQEWIYPTRDEDPAQGDGQQTGDTDQDGGGDAAQDEDDDQDDDLDYDADPVLTYVVVHGCADPEQNGHKRPTRQGHDIGGGSTVVDDEAAKEAKRAERRNVIEGNKAWRAAEPIRRDWLRTLLARKTAPKGSAALIAAALATGEGNMTEGRELAAKLLGLPASAGITPAAATATDNRAQVIALALVLGAYEAAMDVQTWRQSQWSQARICRYFQFIEANGYPLDDIERKAAGIPKPKATRKTADKADKAEKAEKADAEAPAA